MTFGKHLTIILKEMCKKVGVKYEDVDFAKEDWYLDWSWTGGDEDSFLEWLTDYFYKNSEARRELFENPTRNKKRCRTVAVFWIFNYGWKLEEE